MSDRIDALRDWFNPVRTPEDEARHAWVEKMANLCIARTMMQNYHVPSPKEAQTRRRKK